MNELDHEEKALMPTTNLVESVHIHPYMCVGFYWKWLQGENILTHYQYG
jgi:hypothetical protein